MGWILVTGCSSGIGKEIVSGLVRSGKPVIACVRNERDAQKLHSEISEGISSPASLLQTVILDVTQFEQIERVFADLKERRIELDALINNAGIVVAAPLEFISREELQKQFDVNVFGLIAITQKAIPFLRSTRGRIVNISSISGFTVTPYLSPYNASKHCVEVFSDALRMELLPWGIDVIVIEPGSIATPIWEKSKKTASQEFEMMSPEAKNLYGKSLQSFTQLAAVTAKSASPASEVLKVVEKALFQKKPRSRYLVGSGARAASLQKYIPDRWRDRLIMKVVNKFSSEK